MIRDFSRYGPNREVDRRGSPRNDCTRNTAELLKQLAGGKDDEPQASNPTPPQTFDPPTFPLKRLAA